MIYASLVALKFCLMTCVAMKFADDDDDEVSVNQQTNILANHSNSTRVYMTYIHFGGRHTCNALIRCVVIIVITAVLIIRDIIPSAVTVKQASKRLHKIQQPNMSSH